MKEVRLERREGLAWVGGGKGLVGGMKRGQGGGVKGSLFDGWVWLQVWDPRAVCWSVVTLLYVEV